MRNDPFKGEVKLGQWSGLRKLARAMRRGKLDPERERAIGQTEILGALHVKRQNERKAKKKAAVRAASSSG